MEKEEGKTLNLLHRTVQEVCRVMKKILLVIAIGFVFISSPLSEAAGSPPEEYLKMKNPFKPADKAVLERGETLYNRKCMGCHGEKGEGTGPMSTKEFTIRPFTRDHLSVRPDGYLLWVCENGLERTMMPAFGPGSDFNLPRDDIWKIVTFIRERFGK